MLFPADTLIVEAAQASAEVDADGLGSFLLGEAPPQPDDLLYAKQLVESVEHQLSPRLLKALIAAADGATHDEIGEADENVVSRGRASQLLYKAQLEVRRFQRADAEGAPPPDPAEPSAVGESRGSRGRLAHVARPALVETSSAPVVVELPPVLIREHEPDSFRSPSSDTKLLICRFGHRHGREVQLELGQGRVSLCFALHVGNNDFSSWVANARAGKVIALLKDMLWERPQPKLFLTDWTGFRVFRTEFVDETKLGPRSTLTFQLISSQVWAEWSVVDPAPRKPRWLTTNNRACHLQRDRR